MQKSGWLSCMQRTYSEKRAASNTDSSSSIGFAVALKHWLVPLQKASGSGINACHAARAYVTSASHGSSACFCEPGIAGMSHHFISV